MTHEVKLEKVINQPTTEVYKALSHGLLFMNCSADSGTMKIDFRVGGKYRIDFYSMSKYNYGEFLEIIPNKKIVFTWCQTFEPDQTPDTKVTIELFPDGSKTRMTLLHTGFKDQLVCDAHKSGWTNGINDMTNEMDDGRLRMVRNFKIPVHKLYEVIKNPSSFFGWMGDLSKGMIDFKQGGKYQLPTKLGEIKGEFLHIIPNEKIEFSWLEGCNGPLESGKVTLNLKQKPDETSNLEIIHDGLTSVEEKINHRKGWEHVTKQMATMVK